MRVLIFGATGMVGQGVLRESLLASDVEHVRTVGRSATGQSHPKLSEVVHRDLTDFSAIEDQLRGFDACFFTLGVTSTGMTEEAYTRVTYDIAAAAGEVLARLNPNMTFVFVSGAGTDSSEKGRVMWARVKGRAENALRAMPFKAVYCFRPGFIQPLHGIQSRTKMYRVLYVVLRPLVWLLRVVTPKSMLTTESLGIAMLNAVRHGAPKPVLDAPDINVLAKSAAE
jgi:uncharacterized protein YbjT (DUF2867 family)